MSTTTTTTSTTSTTNTNLTNTSKPNKINITADYGITKIINKNGTGNNYPFDGDQVYVHIIGKTIDGTIFENTRNKACYSFILGNTGETIKGYNYAIKSMKKGEISTFTIRAKYAFGTIGNGDTVPPNATCIYEIELISFTNSSDISIEKDGSILKKIINNSNNNNSSNQPTIPKYESKVLIDFKIKTKESNEVLQERTRYSFQIGQDTLMLDIVEKILETMQSGEQCVVEVEWSTFYKSLNQWPSDKLLPKFKKLIKNNIEEKIIIEITLIEIQSFEKDIYQYQVNEMTNIGLLKKEEGTALFKQQYYNMARLKYKRALEFFEFEYGKNEEEKLIIKQHKISCLSNQSVCNLLMKQYKQVIELTTMVLQLDSNHIKSLNSRSKALRESGKLNLALYDIQRALKIDSHNKDTLNELSIINKLKEKENKK